MNINENLKEIVKISFLIIKNIFNNFCLFNNLRYFFKYLFIISLNYICSSYYIILKVIFIKN